MIEILPSILSANFGHLEEDLKKVESAGCQKIHLDVMDGHFVPNLTIGPVVLKSLRKVSSLFFDTHLMIEEPSRYLKDFVEAGASSITVHQEACRDVRETVRQIKQLGIPAGIALRPKTPVDSIRDILPEVDLALVMTVEPGFGGQEYIPGSENKVRELKALLNELGLAIPIQVDGGIGAETAPLVVKAGATQLVAGSAVFSGDPQTNIRKIKESLLA